MRGLSSSTMDSAEEGAARLTRCKEMMDQILAAMKKLRVTVDFEANTALLRAANQAFYKPMDSDSASSNTKPANNNSTSSNALLTAPSAPQDIAPSIPITNPDNCEHEIDRPPRQQQACNNLRNTAHIFLDPCSVRC